MTADDEVAAIATVTLAFAADRSRDGRGRIHTNILPPCRGSFAPSEAVPSGTVA